MSLAERLKAAVSQDGPMSVAAFMTACLHDPQGGYYATRPNLGAGGDFITAPLVSQMFGELIGLWAAQTWMDMGAPERLLLVELGPGDGTLIGDLLRAVKRVPGFLDAAELWLVEPSSPLQALQRERLGADGACWAARLGDVPTGAPMILIANEVLDCLPARQFIRTPTGWAERRIGLDEAGELVFGLSETGPDAFPPSLDGAPVGSVLEQSAAQEALGAEIGYRLAEDGGAALLIDYGRDRFGFGDTLQAVRAHRKVGVLDAPGEADLTVHADFPAVAAAARDSGATASDILTQGDFLKRLGIEARAATLAAGNPNLADTLARQLGRLIDADKMGELFKVLALSSPGLIPPVFEAPS
jgi:SAM-dependent MidA family methyltransferase